MAIGDNEQTIANSDLSSMNASDFSAAVGSANDVAFTSTTTSGWGPWSSTETTDISAESFAGIKEGFLTALDEAIDGYIEAIDTKLSQLNTSPNIRQAFRGESVEAALQNLISGVDAEAKSYSKALKEAEQAIVKAVSEAYATHDTGVSGDINSDASTLG